MDDLNTLHQLCKEYLMEKKPNKWTEICVIMIRQFDKPASYEIARILEVGLRSPDDTNV